jgi:hypothetical protein
VAVPLRAVLLPVVPAVGAGVDRSLAAHSHSGSSPRAGASRSGGLPWATDAVWTTVEGQRLWRVPLAGGPARAVRVAGFPYGLAADSGAVWGAVRCRPSR